MVALSSMHFTSHSSSSESSSCFRPEPNLRFVILCSATRRRAVLLAAWLNRCSSCLLRRSNVATVLSKDSLRAIVCSSRSPTRASVHLPRTNSIVFSISPIFRSSLTFFSLSLSSTMSLAATLLFSQAQNRSFSSLNSFTTLSGLKPRSYISRRDFPVQTRSLATHRSYSDSILARALDKFSAERPDSAGSESSASLPWRTSRN